jgi:hypothetical protein
LTATRIATTLVLKAVLKITVILGVSLKWGPKRSLVNEMSFALLIGEAKVFKHGKAKTLYVTIPSAMAQDSAFTIKDGDTVELEFDKEKNAVILRPKVSRSRSTHRSGSS